MHNEYAEGEMSNKQAGFPANKTAVKSDGEQSTFLLHFNQTLILCLGEIDPLKHLTVIMLNLNQVFNSFCKFILSYTLTILQLIDGLYEMKIYIRSYLVFFSVF